ncbi:MAG: DNA translocase FtsK 4TM domain-containing protein [Lachnospiraceae bacterium]|nr:DNA translocase FtsK 4TM domain-containing protein [Lachnospiraceae bacterium]
MVDIYLLLFLLVTILLFLGNLGLGGVFGKTVCGFFFGLFGLLNYFLPPALCLGAFYYVSNKNDAYAIRKLIYTAFFAWFLMMFIELLTHGEPALSIPEVFYASRDNHKGGGLMGGILSSFFQTAFGYVGAYAVDIICLLLFLVLMTERSGVRKLQEEKRKHDAWVEERKAVGPDIMIESPGRLARRNRQTDAEDARNKVRPFVKAPGRQKTRISNGEKIKNGASKLRQDRKIQGVSLNTEIPQDAVTPLSSGENSDVKNPVSMEVNSKEVEIQSVDSYQLKSGQEEKLEQAAPRIHSAFQPEGSSSDPARSSAKWSGGSTDSDPALYANHTDQAYQNGVPNSSEDKVQARKALDPLLERAEEDQKLQVKEGLAKTHSSAGSGNGSNSERAAEAEAEKKPYIYPPASLLNTVKKQSREDDAVLHGTAMKLVETLKNFGIHVTVTDISRGPAVTRYELQPEMGVKVSRIVNLQDDIKMNLAATDIRIEAPIPGKAAIGIEVPNKEPSMVPFREIVETPEFKNAKSKIAFAVGRDIAGKVVISDIAKMPHLLIAGATGSGKSVCINTVIMSILYRATPDEVKFIMIDPKVVELSVYNGIPHLLIPVVTDPKKASAALQWAVNEMTLRYKKFADTHVRDMKGYNSKIHDGQMTVYNENGEEEVIPAQKMPQLVVIVDELADLMMVASKEVEESICRLAQLARAAGIHLIIATQRPSVNVITGLIKANMPSRIAFSVTSGVDSRTILDMTGAEKLLGKGDMLYYPQGLSKPIRVQGCFVSDEEVGRVVHFLKSNNESQGYDPAIQEEMQKAENDGYQSIDGNGGGFTNDRDEYFEDAARLVIEKEKGSIGMLQRNFKIGFNRAARIMDQLEDFGVVGPEEGTKPRRILLTIEAFDQKLTEEAS